MYINLFLLLLAFGNGLTAYQGLEGLYEEPTTWLAGKNEFPSNFEEMRTLLGVLRRNQYTSKSTVQRTRVENDTELPENFDARKQWGNCRTIDRIANQGRCGSCWAVAAATAFSDRLCIASRGKTSVYLSYHQLTTCCYRCGYGCGGGLPELAWDFMHYHGLVTGGLRGCQPYRIKEDRKCYPANCTNKYYPTPYKKDLHKTTAPVILEVDEETIKSEIFKNGPVEACFDVYSDFRSYKSGVYKRTESAKYAGGHAIRIIGWGVQNGLKYWLCANSWGRRWGDKGTFKILRGSNECQIEDRIIVGKPNIK